MLNTKDKDVSVKYTTVLPQQYLNELKILADNHTISSVSQGIRMAVESFLQLQKRRAYAASLREAAADTAFIKRTTDAQNDFAVVDAEGEEAW